MLPSLSGTLGMARAKHLLRRSTYRITKQRIDQFAAMTADAAVEQLLTPVPLSMDEPLDYNSGQPFINTPLPANLSNGQKERAIKAWWMNEAFLDPSIHHKMVFFLHQYFTVNIGQGAEDMESSFDYLNLLRLYALGSYKTLAGKMTLNNAMLGYLDGHSNTVNNPNENYAREFLELFTIGKGEQIAPGNYTNYTEADIAVAAKLLSGWKRSDRTVPPDPSSIDLDTGLTAGYPYYNHHDNSHKTFSAAFGGQTISGAVNQSDMYRELDDFVDMVFDQPETAKAICRRLYRYFVRSTISAATENDIIVPLANTLRDNNYELVAVLRELLKSRHFYDEDDSASNDHIIGAIIKSPMELLFQTLSFFQIPIPDPATDALQHYEEWYRKSVDETIFSLSGFSALMPGQVAGYPAYYQAPGYDRNWINSGTIVARYKIPEMLIKGKRILRSGDLGNGVRIDLVDFVENSQVVSDPSQAHTVVSELIGYLLPQPPSDARYGYFINEVFLSGAPAFDWTLDWIAYQNTGDDAAVRIPLEKLFTALLFSQEYQMM